MTDLICRKTMMRCQTQGMCAPFGGCRPSVLADCKTAQSNSSEAPSPADHVEDVRAMVAKPSPAGVDGLKVVGYIQRGGIDGAEWEEGGAPQSVPVTPVADAQAIIDGLRAELGAAVEMLSQSRARNTALRQRRDQLAGLLLDKFPRIDPGKPYPLDEVKHHCEYTLYQERERLHREIDAALAELK